MAYISHFFIIFYNSLDKNLKKVYTVRLYHKSDIAP